MRTVTIPAWVKALVDDWLHITCIAEGRVFRRVDNAGKVSDCSISEKAVWHAVRQYASAAGLGKLAPYDLRRTCARLCHTAGGELEQIQFLIVHVSIQTTERYLGCDKRVYEHSTHLLSLAKTRKRYYGGRSFTTCAVSSLLREVGLASARQSLYRASDPGGSRNGSTQMRS